MTRQKGRAGGMPTRLTRSISARGGLAVLLALSVLAGCEPEPALLRQAQKATLVEALRAELLASVEAEKSAVMATTDEASKAFADESRRRAATSTALRDELHERVTADARPGELRKLATFDEAWAELRDVDARLLDLAVANSNLKAARLAAGDAAVALDRLVDALAAAEATGTDPTELRRLAAAAVAALRIQTLLAPHIASADDAEMTRLEGRMQALGESVRGVLPQAGNEAGAAWADYERLVTEVRRLSRLNTNVRSVDVSLNEKRRATEACRSALAALLHEIHAGASPGR